MLSVHICMEEGFLSFVRDFIANSAAKSSCLLMFIKLSSSIQGPPINTRWQVAPQPPVLARSKQMISCGGEVKWEPLNDG